MDILFPLVRLLRRMAEVHCKGNTNDGGGGALDDDDMEYDNAGPGDGGLASIINDKDV